MDIENMHPFCLPFGLCHDATSSIISITDSSTGKEEKERSGTCSPTDELFNQLNDHSICHSLLDHDTIIDSSSLMDEDATFRSLELDIDQDQGTDVDTFDYGTDEFDENISISNNQSVLLSPLSPTGYCHRTKRRKLSTYMRTSITNNYHLHHHHNVFHEIDPIDIKSSPTLAQLNLNSNDDQNDGLWETTSTRLHPPTSTDLIASSNCTSIHAGSKCTSTSVCNNLHLSDHNHHLHHHHHQNNHHHHQQHLHHHQHGNQLYPSLPMNHLTSCQHIASNQHPHDSSNKLNSSQSHMQSGCLSLQHYRKSVPDLNHCCNHDLIMLNNQNSNSNSNHISDNCNLKDSASLNQANNNLRDSNELLQGNSQQTFNNINGDKHQLVVNNNRTLSQRSASPALVTSSSSPLSSFLSGANCNNKDSRVIDNHLKENIDYLTALLCNGHKLECSTSQQPIISSTMIKSYTALAHTLSTGPKLLERPSVQPQIVVDGNKQQQQRLIKCPNEIVSCRPHETNLANPHVVTQFEQQQQQWSKQQALVESSVSAADSTESQVTSQSLGASADEANNNRVVSALPMGAINVMSSAKRSLETIGNPSGTTGYNPLLMTSNGSGSRDTDESCLRQQLTNPLAPPKTQDISSFPPNGKPITLTPIATNNSIIVQQQHGSMAHRTPLFAQPASPSSSASSGNTEIGSSSSLSTSTSARFTPKKRPATTGVRGSNQTGSDRSGRPNSLSTDCSLSSHDEGFASQMDNEDCASNKDSDDEDDIDSDDESFYGDYTNNDLIGASISDDPENKWTLNMGRTRRNGQKRFFWQYNVQSKGPKGTRICSTDNPEDPFVLPEASDPVFSNDCQVEGVKHSGKARRGDGNDLTPNPRKLLMIGLELKKLSKVINELAPVTDLPLNVRNTTRKEKNKLASRACRLKKKAQHEANKIKLYGLQREHQQVVMAIFDARKLINEKLTQFNLEKANCLAKMGVGDNIDDIGSISAQVERMAKQCSMFVAGQTSDYVNSVLEKVVSGCIDGGLQT